MRLPLPALIVAAAVPWWSSSACHGQGATNAAPVTFSTNVAFPAHETKPKTPAKRTPLPKFRDDLLLDDPGRRELIDPIYSSSPGVVSNLAGSVGVVDSWEVVPHSNLGILRGDLKALERSIDPEIRPEWLIQRFQRLAERKNPKPAVMVTNAGR